MTRKDGIQGSDDVVTSGGITKELRATMQQALNVQSKPSNFRSSFGSLFLRVASSKKKEEKKTKKKGAHDDSHSFQRPVSAASSTAFQLRSRVPRRRRVFGAPLTRGPCTFRESTVPVRAVYARHTSKALLLKEKRRHLKGTAVAGPPPASSKAPLWSLCAWVKPFN